MLRRLSATKMGLTINGTTFYTCPLEEKDGWLLVGWCTEQPQRRREVWARIENKKRSAKGSATFKFVASNGKATEIECSDITY